MKPGPFICVACGARGSPKRHVRGSVWIEIVLWCCFLVPGLLYSLWRLSTKEPVCRSCGTPGMIPVNTPRGRQLAAELGQQ